MALTFAQATGQVFPGARILILIFVRLAERRFSNFFPSAMDRLQLVRLFLENS